MTTTQSDPRHAANVTGANSAYTTTHSAQDSAGTLAAGETDSVQLDIVTAPKRDSKTWAAGTIAWEDLLVWMDFPADRKEAGNYVLGRLEGDRRTKDTILDRCALTLDVDHPKADFLDRLAAELEGYTAVAHTTYTSTPDAPRYRIIIPLTQRVDPEQYGVAARVLMRNLGEEEFDGGSDQGERYMFLPSENTPGYFDHRVLTGGLLDAGTLLAQATDEDKRPLKDHQAFATAPADATPYNALPALLQEQADEYVAREIERHRVIMDEIVTWDEGETDEQGRGWERLTANAAFTLAQLGHAPWSPLSLDDAQGRYEEIVPEAIREDEECCDKWTLKSRSAASSPLAAPWQTGDFEPVADDDPMLDGTPAPAEKDSPEDQRERQVRAELERMVVREEARRRLAALSRVAPEMPAPIGLNELLTAHLDAPRWRIADMWPAGGRVNLVASAKSGKTTTTGNIVRSLVDGEDFLGNETRPLGPGETVTIFDTEMTEVQLQDWYRDLGLRNADKVRIVSLVGRASGLNFLDQDALRTLVPQYAGSHTYILDPLGPVLSGLGLEENSNSEVQRFLSAWDTFVTLLGGQESMVTHHAGHSAERARGASAFIGSGSAIWTLVNKDPDDPMSARYIKAIGRGVNVPETLLVHDPFTRRLSLGTGSRAQNKKSDKIDALADAIHQAVASHPGITAGELEKRLRADGVSFQKGDVSKATALAENRGLVRVEQVKRAKHFHPSDDSDLL